jgi:hypothetical protein
MAEDQDYATARRPKAALGRRAVSGHLLEA